MNSMRALAVLLFLWLLASCTSADVVVRKPQDVQDIPKKTDSAQAPRRAIPALPERTAVPAPIQPMPRPGPATVAPVQPVIPPPSTPITSCDPGGCWSAGQRFNGGTGNVYLDRNGRMCQGNGTWMQCF